MQYRWLPLVALVALACSHHEDTRPPASANSVEQATDTPSSGPEFTPPQNQPGASDQGANGAGTLTGNGSAGTSGPNDTATPGGGPAPGGAKAPAGNPAP